MVQLYSDNFSSYEENPNLIFIRTHVSDNNKRHL